MTYVDPSTAPFIDSELESLERVVDGDSAYVTRLIHIGLTEDLEHLARDRKPREIRLVVVNTPERKTGAPYLAAKADLQAFFASHPRLRVRVYGRDDFGRLLADVYDPQTGESASAYLIAKGWPPYIP